MRCFIILLFLLSLNSFGQLQKYSWGDVVPHDTSDRFTIDTLKKSDDTVFTLVKHFIGGHLLHQEEQINIKTKATVSHGNANDFNGYRTFWHGHSIQWYPNGRKRCEGTFKFGLKLNDWKYWNMNGKEILEPYDCNLLDAALNSEQLQKHFLLCKDEKEPLIIIDTNYYFVNNCHNLLPCHRKVQVIADLPNNFKTDCNNIVLYKITKGTSIIMQFIQPCSNANIILELKTHKHKLKVKIISIGIF